MQIFDCRTSPVRLQSFVPCFPLGSFPIAIAAINLSRAWATKWVNTVHTPNVSRSQSQANCDSRMAFPYVSASCCGNFLHILATTFSTSLEFLLVLFLPSSFLFFVLFLLRQQKPKAAATRSLLVFVLASPKGGKFSRRDGVTCHRRGFR